MIIILSSFFKNIVFRKFMSNSNKDIERRSLLILFDIDGTIAESSQQVSQEMIAKINEKIEAGYDIGIVGGGTFEKVSSQLGPLNITHYFTECGCVYHTRNSYGLIYNVYKKNIRQHPLYSKINILVKEALQFIAKVDYEITGHFIDLRNGIIYISLIGMVATLEERAKFIENNNKNNYRKGLISQLKNKAFELKIDNDVVIAEGGTVGVGIYPKEYDKVQVMEVIQPFGYEEIHYFGDKYEEDGNDYYLLNHKNIIPHRVNSLEDTMRELNF
jgi:phosphomannomutase